MNKNYLHVWKDNNNTNWSFAEGMNTLLPSICYINKKFYFSWYPFEIIKNRIKEYILKHFYTPEELIFHLEWKVGWFECHKHLGKEEIKITDNDIIIFEDNYFQDYQDEKLRPLDHTLYVITHGYVK
jgi:hypothetical protein